MNKIIDKFDNLIKLYFKRIFLTNKKTFFLGFYIN